MAYESQPIILPGFLAGADLSAKQYYWVKPASTAKEVVVVSAATSTAIGVLLNDPEDGEEARVCGGGCCPVVAGTSVGWKAGRRVGWNTTGKAVPRYTNVSPPDPAGYYGGIYLGHEGTTIATGDILTIQVLGGSGWN